MSLGATKKCFPPATQCHNCDRKYRVKVAEKKDEEFSRCSECHLMTYCDRDCQREHWNAVHKHHCRFLSGKKVVANSEHNSASCAWCINEQEGIPDEFIHINSPKTICYIQKLLDTMKENLGLFSEFHEEGSTCGCSLKFGCNLPFSPGEISGQYIGSGMDEMVAHAIRLAHAMLVKTRSQTVSKTLAGLLVLRAVIWMRALTFGEASTERRFKDEEMFTDLLKDLDKCFEPNSPWFKALKFSIDIVAHMDRLLLYNNIDLRDLEDSRLVNVKKGYKYDEQQIKNILKVCQSKLWANFKMWPTLSGGLLVLQLPDGIRCDSCEVELKSEVAYDESQEANIPLLKRAIGSNGGLVAICSNDRNPSCSTSYNSKTPKMCLPQFNLFIAEWNSFLIKSRVCDVCFKYSFSSHRCSQCLASQYCSAECQKMDLDFHKTVCEDWAKDESKKIVSSSQQRKANKKKFESFIDQQN